MAGSPLPVVAALLFFVSSLVFRVSLATMQPLCPRLSVPFLDDLGSQCPRCIELPLRQEVRGETLERYLNCGDQYCSVLFGVSWCPFSRNIQPIFDALSSMFPQIKHLLVEESSIMPSVLSRNGIHSFPAIMLINQTSRIRYHGPKDLNSLVHFYKKSTGLNPIMYLAIDQSGSGNVKSPVLEVESASELITKEPYLTFGIIYIGLKIIICSFSAIYSCFKAFWVSHACHLNLSFLRESSRLLEQMLHVVEVNGLWSNLRFCNKTSNFQKGQIMSGPGRLPSLQSPWLEQHDGVREIEAMAMAGDQTLLLHNTLPSVAMMAQGRLLRVSGSSRACSWMPICEH